ncbi:MAG: FKBP-type peptidyl-prolyl cis-trans isomerase [Pedosphaera sp.]|nr:FKBP-type peptidyl-prolyl cis-trans isomerase [Pedosphaera sp.]
MKQPLIVIFGLGLLVLTVQAQDKKSDEKNAFKDEKEKVSYAIGMNTASTWKRMELDVDTDVIAKGMKDVMAGNPMLMTEQEAREVLTKFSQELKTKQEAKLKLQAEKNRQEGEVFLATNKTKDGVITLPSGLQYKVVSEGKGNSPKADEMVTLNYRGTLVDGTEFDSSEKRGRPLNIPVARTGMKGWTEALQLMKPGAKWQLFLSPSLAYGDSGRPPVIGPSTTVVFELELLSVSAAPPAAPAVQPLTSDIIKVPSAEELKKGAKIETIKPEDLEKERAKEKK